MPRYPVDFDTLWERANNIGLKAVALREKLKEFNPNIDEVSFSTSKGLLEGSFEVAKKALDKLEQLINALSAS